MVMHWCTAVICLAALCAAETDAQVRPPRRITVVTGSWEPFTGRKLEGGGPVADLVSDVLRRMNRAPTYSFQNWDTAESMVYDGEISLAFPFIKTPEREAKFSFSEPLLRFSYVLFYHKKKFPKGADIRDLEDLSQARLGQIRGYAVWTELAGKVKKIIPFDSPHEGFLGLDRGDIDVLPESRIVGQRLLYAASLPLDAGDFAFIDPAEGAVASVTRQTGVHVIARKTPAGSAFLDTFNEALAEARQSAFYREIVADLKNFDGGEDYGVLRGLKDAVYPSVLIDGQDRFVNIGTRVVVLDWADSSGDLPTVKILNGPLRGRIGQVPSRAIELTDAPRNSSP